jgi:hypothetical protein
MTEALGFGGLLRQPRAAVKLTQEELAEAAALSPRSASWPPWTRRPGRPRDLRLSR